MNLYYQKNYIFSTKTIISLLENVKDGAFIINYNLLQQTPPALKKFFNFINYMLSYYPYGK